MTKIPLVVGQFGREALDSNFLKNLKIIQTYPDLPIRSKSSPIL